MAGRIGKGVASLVGLAQEAHAHNKEKKEAAALASTQSDASLPTANDVEVDEDEDDWIADDAQQQLHSREPEEFKKRHPPPKNPIAPMARLPAPVIIPQRRPDMKSRGFVRAYARALAACGVDQNAFLDFIDGFHKEITKHGYFNASNIAVALSAMSYTLSVAPSAVVHFSAMAVHISIETGRRLYISKKTNSYIDEINAAYFQPRGLYAMIVS